VNYADPSGHFAFWAALAIAGAALGFGLAAYNDYQVDGIWFNGNAGSYIACILGGAIIGAASGACISAVLTGNFLASIGAVKAGAVLTHQMVNAAGIGAAGAMLASNFSNALHYSTHIFWSGGELSKNAARELADILGGTTLEMTQLGHYLENLSGFNAEAWRIASVNFANQVQSGSTAFVVHNLSGIRLASIWATVEYPILIQKIIDLIFVVV
jgi:hypothetical protein